MAKTTDVRKRGNTLPVTDLMDDIARDSGAGFDEATRDAFAIPFLSILQDLSPQVKKNMSGFVKGAQVGDIFHSVTHEMFKEIRVIPCYFSQVFIEWIPRKKGGGFVKSYDAQAGAALMQTATRSDALNVLPNGNELADTRQHFVLLVKSDGSTDGCLIAMKSTQLKISRRWMSQMRSGVIEHKGKIIAPPMFAWSYKLDGSAEESNEQGSWHTWHISERERVTDADLYRRAKMFGVAMKSGAAKINYEEMQRSEAPDRAGSEEFDNDMDV